MYQYYTKKCPKNAEMDQVLQLCGARDQHKKTFSVL